MGKDGRRDPIGWISEPWEITDDVINEIRLTPRFAMRETHGDGPAKIRSVDDFLISGARGLVSMRVADIPQNIDVFLATAVLYRSIAPRVPLRAFSVGYAHAYKNVPLDRGHADLATIVVVPPGGTPRAAKLRTQPFGAARSPANWGRVTQCARWALSQIFGIDLYAYVDDCFCLEPFDTAESAFRVVKRFNELFGSPSKKGRRARRPIRSSF